MGKLFHSLLLAGIAVVAMLCLPTASQAQYHYAYDYCPTATYYSSPHVYSSAYYSPSYYYAPRTYSSFYPMSTSYYNYYPTAYAPYYTSSYYYYPSYYYGPGYRV